MEGLQVLPGVYTRYSSTGRSTLRDKKVQGGRVEKVSRHRLTAVVWYLVKVYLVAPWQYSQQSDAHVSEILLIIPHPNTIYCKLVKSMLEREKERFACNAHMNGAHPWLAKNTTNSSTRYLVYIYQVYVYTMVNSSENLLLIYTEQSRMA